MLKKKGKEKVSIFANFSKNYIWKIIVTKREEIFSYLPHVQANYWLIDRKKQDKFSKIFEEIQNANKTNHETELLILTYNITPN